MGLARRPAPHKLSQKLLLIRQRLGLSQNEMLRALNVAGSYDRASISGYERGERQPPLTVLLRYAQVANICLDVLADDEEDLPEKLPARKRSH